MFEVDMRIYGTRRRVDPQIGDEVVLVGRQGDSVVTHRRHGEHAGHDPLRAVHRVRAAHAQSVRVGSRAESRGEGGFACPSRTFRWRTSARRWRPAASARWPTAARRRCSGWGTPRRACSSWARRRARTRICRASPSWARPGSTSTQLLAIAGLAREHVFIANVLKCRPRRETATRARRRSSSAPRTCASRRAPSTPSSSSPWATSPRSSY